MFNDKMLLTQPGLLEAMRKTIGKVKIRIRMRRARLGNAETETKSRVYNGTSGYEPRGFNIRHILQPTVAGASCKASYRRPKSAFLLRDISPGKSCLVIPR